MSTQSQSHHRDRVQKRPRSLAFAAAPLALAAVLSACQTTTGDLYEGIGYREARFAEISAMREYRSCVDEALQLDAQAREQGDAARYLASARLLEQCEAGVGPDAGRVAEEERMRAYALSIQNHLKGGDVEGARENLERFKQTFRGRDLYYADGSSFTDTMEVLLTGPQGRMPFVNISDPVRSEMRRLAHWQRR